MYLFTLMLLFRLTIKTYLSPQLLLYLPIDVSVHDPTCSLSYFLLIYNIIFYHGPFLFGITCTINVPLICWGMYTQIHPKINLPVYLLCLRKKNKKNCLSPQLHMYLPLNVPVHDPTCLFS